MIQEHNTLKKAGGILLNLQIISEFIRIIIKLKAQFYMK